MGLGSIPVFLSPAVDVNDPHHAPVALPPGEEQCTHFIGDCLGPTVQQKIG